MVSKSLTKQLSYWQSSFGDSYTERTSDSSMFEKRKGFFKKLLNRFPDILSVLEVGCNVGKNLELLHSTNNKLELFGVEPNKKAVSIAKATLSDINIFQKSIFDIDWQNKFDLVFTAGVLIHIADDDIGKALTKIYNASKKYILAIEYYTDKRTTIPYRGLPDALFKRPYDKEYLDLFPNLKVTFSGDLGQVQGFDNCKFWLFEK